MRAISRVSPWISLESTSVRKAQLRGRGARPRPAPGGCCRPRCCARARNTASPGLGVSANLAAHAALQALADGGGHAAEDAVFLQDGGGAGERGGIGRGGAGADHVEIVADHVGEQQRFHRAGAARRASCPPLIARDVFAHGIDLVDVGAASQQQLRGRLFFLERDRAARAAAAAPTRRRKSGTAPGRRARAAAAISAMRCAPATPRSSGTGWPHSFSSMRRSCAVWPYFTFIRPAVMRRPEHALRGPRHGRAGFARADHVDVAEAREIRARADGARRRRPGRLRASAARKIARAPGGAALAGAHLSSGWCRMASTVTAGSSLSMGMRTSASA